MTATIGEKLAQLAVAIADDALESDDVELRLDAFKVLTAYHVGVSKLKKPETSDEESFEQFKQLGTL